MHTGRDLRRRRRPPTGIPDAGPVVRCRARPSSGRALYVPEGCAHGFQTLVDDSDVTYMISMPYAPEAAAGVRWDDPTLAIAWPEAPSA